MSQTQNPDMNRAEKLHAQNICFKLKNDQHLPLMLFIPPIDLMTQILVNVRDSAINVANIGTLTFNKTETGLISQTQSFFG